MVGGRNMVGEGCTVTYSFMIFFVLLFHLLQITQNLINCCFFGFNSVGKE